MKKVIVTSGWGVRYLTGGGMQWLNLHYLAGLRALGYDGYWLDLCNPARTSKNPQTPVAAIEAFGEQCARYGWEEHWAVVYNRQETFGLSRRQLNALCEDAVLLINLSGSLKDDDLLRRIKRRAYFDLDPGFTQIWAQDWDMDFSKHDLFFTVGLNVGQPDFPVPLRGIPWQTFPPPVALEYWPAQTDSPTAPFTTVGQWRGQQAWWQNELYGPKCDEFLRLIDLPQRTSQPLELALLIHKTETDDIDRLREHGWRLADPHRVAAGAEGMRTYIQQSRAEFSVAKSGYVKSRSGWFSDRTVCYLASGRPVLVQDTGLGKALPTGQGLLTFNAIEEAVRGIDSINADYAAHARAARRLAEERFAAPVVLQSILDRAGIR